LISGSARVRDTIRSDTSQVPEPVPAWVGIVDPGKPVPANAFAQTGIFFDPVTRPTNRRENPAAPRARGVPIGLVPAPLLGIALLRAPTRGSDSAGATNGHATIAVRVNKHIATLDPNVVRNASDEIKRQNQRGKGKRAKKASPMNPMLNTQPNPFMGEGPPGF